MIIMPPPPPNSPPHQYSAGGGERALAKIPSPHPFLFARPLLGSECEKK